jgi:hypothetical protein
LEEELIWAQMPADDEVPTLAMEEQPLADWVEIREIFRNTVFAAEIRLRIARLAIAPAFPTPPALLQLLLLLLDLAAHWANCCR